jgi:alpha-soluble NSF attachment protein
VEAVESGDQDAYTGAVVEFDQVMRLDNWKTGILLKIKRSIENDEEDFT